MTREMPLTTQTFQVYAKDYQRAGEASASIKKTLRELNLSSAMLRRISVASYEAELNLVIHSLGGSLQLTIDGEKITLMSTDLGPGIKDVREAMRSGFSTATDEARDFGFGAGMGLPNMQKNASQFEITSEEGGETRVIMHFFLGDADFNDQP